MYIKETAEKVQKILNFKNYFQFDFFTEEMKDAYTVSNLVVARGGFGTLSEVSALKKPTIIIPNSGHQQDNVKFLTSATALLSFDEDNISGVQLAKVIKDLLVDKSKMVEMGEKLNTLLPNAKENDILEIIGELLKK